MIAHDAQRGLARAATEPVGGVREPIEVERPSEQEPGGKRDDRGRQVPKRSSQAHSHAAPATGDSSSDQGKQKRAAREVDVVKRCPALEREPG